MITAIRKGKYVSQNISFFRKIASMRVESDMSDDEEEVMIQDSSPVASPTNVITDVESRYPIRNRRPTCIDTDRIFMNSEHM